MMAVSENQDAQIAQQTHTTYRFEEWPEFRLHEPFHFWVEPELPGEASQRLVRSNSYRRTSGMGSVAVRYPFDLKSFALRAMGDS